MFVANRHPLLIEIALPSAINEVKFLQILTLTCPTLPCCTSHIPTTPDPTPSLRIYSNNGLNASSLCATVMIFPVWSVACWYSASLSPTTNAQCTHVVVSQQQRATLIHILTSPSTPDCLYDPPYDLSFSDFDSVGHFGSSCHLQCPYSLLHCPL